MQATIELLPKPFKVCTKCGDHLTKAQWKALPKLGDMPSGLPGFKLELRNHGCRGTISIMIPDGARHV